jgi:hypothetical protein
MWDAYISQPYRPPWPVTSKEEKRREEERRGEERREENRREETRREEKRKDEERREEKRRDEERREEKRREEKRSLRSQPSREGNLQRFAGVALAKRRLRRLQPTCSSPDPHLHGFISAVPSCVKRKE